MNGIFDRFEAVCKSPVFEGNLILAALDEILIATNASRLDATDEDGTVIFSSALLRERKADSRQWTKNAGVASDCFSSGYKWEWKADEPFTGSSRDLRSQLATSTLRLSIHLPDAGLEANGTRITRLLLWFQGDSAPSNDEIRDSLVHACLAKLPEALRKFSRDPHRANGSRAHRDSSLFEMLADRGAQKHLTDILEEFDEWIRGFVKPISESLASFPFLIEYFWVMRHSCVDSSGGTHYACVKPIFLRKQSELLIRAYEPLREKRLDEPDRPKPLEWIWNYELDSRSLFGAFPAETQLSLFLSDWEKERLPIPPDDRHMKLRAAFKELTSAAQRQSAKESGISQEVGSLLSIPVLIGDEVLFTATMILPRTMAATERANLATEVRRLGGIILRQARAYEAYVKTKQDLDQEKGRNELKQRAVLLRALDEVTRDIPARIQRPLNAVVMRSAAESSSCCIPLDEVNKILGACVSVINQAEQIKRNITYEDGTGEIDIDLADVLEEAIRRTQNTRRFSIDLDARRQEGWTVRAHKNTLVAVFCEILLRVEQLSTRRQGAAEDSLVATKIGVALAETGVHAEVAIPFACDAEMLPCVRDLDGQPPETFECAVQLISTTHGSVDFPVVSLGDRSRQRKCSVLIPLSTVVEPNQ